MTAAVLCCAACQEETTVLDADDLQAAIVDHEAQHADCGTPPSEALWRRLTARGAAATLIEHGGDASKVIPFPRPSWSDPDRDQVGASVLAACYRSAVASVAATHGGGWDFGDEYLAARLNVSAKLFGNGVRSVGLSVQKKAASETVGLSLTLDEARQLAEVLTAAADLAECG